jgi:hypothetical protein
MRKLILLSSQFLTISSALSSMLDLFLNTVRRQEDETIHFSESVNCEKHSVLNKRRGSTHQQELGTVKHTAGTHWEKNAQ